jgi:hypothetical protein
MFSRFGSNLDPFWAKFGSNSEKRTPCFLKQYCSNCFIFTQTYRLQFKNKSGYNLEQLRLQFTKKQVTTYKHQGYSLQNLRLRFISKSGYTLQKNGYNLQKMVTIRKNSGDNLQKFRLQFTKNTVTSYNFKATMKKRKVTIYKK